MSDAYPNIPRFKHTGKKLVVDTEPLVRACLDAAEAAGVERPVEVAWVLNPLVKRPQRAIWGGLS